MIPKIQSCFNCESTSEAESEWFFKTTCLSPTETNIQMERANINTEKKRLVVNRAMRWTRGLSCSSLTELSGSRIMWKPGRQVKQNKDFVNRLSKEIQPTNGLSGRRWANSIEEIRFYNRRTVQMRIKSISFDLFEAFLRLYETMQCWMLRASQWTKSFVQGLYSSVPLILQTQRILVWDFGGYQQKGSSAGWLSEKSIAISRSNTVYDQQVVASLIYICFRAIQKYKTIFNWNRIRFTSSPNDRPNKLGFFNLRSISHWY